MSGRTALFLTEEPLGERLAGPAIRALELARAVARSGAVDVVRLVSLTSCERADAEVQLFAGGPNLVDMAEATDVVVLQGDVLNRVPGLVDIDVPVVVDAYDPFHLEQLEQTRGLDPAERVRIVRDCVRALNDQLGRADLVLCASPRQRSLWLGHLTALGRVNPLTYDESPDLDGLVAVVPFGTSASTAPAGSRTQLLDPSFPGITDDDVLLIWGGGLYPWFDADVLLEAMARLRATHPRVKLLFLGTRHPLAPDEDSAVVRALKGSAARDGTLDRSVFFHDGWVPYDERHSWLGSADVGVSTHHPHLETEFSYRTRVVDYLAAGLPVVTTDGDALADLVRAGGCGVVVRPHDADGLTDALAQLADDAGRRRELSARASVEARRLDWDTVAAPLIEFVRAPRRAPDLVAPVDTRALLSVARGGAVQRVRAAVAEGGVGLVADRIKARLARISGARGRGDR